MKKKKAQMGIFASANTSNKIPLISEDPKPVKEPVFKTKAEFDAYYLNQSLQKLSPEDKLWYDDAVAGRVKNVTPQDIIALRAPTPFHAKFNIKGKKEPMGNVLGRAYGVMQKGGIIQDNMGQLKHPGKITKINSPNITMKGVGFPVLGVSDIGDTKMMLPNQDYTFDGNSVTEFPLAKSGIHINPKNKGKFNALKKKTGKSTEELTHSKNPLTRKRAIFAQNAKKWNKGQMGLPPIETDWGSEDVFAPGQFSVEGQLNQFNATLPEQQGFLGKIGEQLGGAQGIYNTATSLIGGIQQIGQDKENRAQAKQFYKLAKLVNKAASLKPEKVKRKYVRPEDNLVQPRELYSPYGTGTNFLKDGGNLQFGGVLPFFEGIGPGRSGNLGQMLGSAIGGGGGVPSGAGQVGSTIGGVAGSILGPVGGAVGSLLGGAIGGIIGGKNQRETARFQRRGNAQLQNAAFSQGTNALHNQYIGFMEHGGNVQMGGELKTYNGEAELISHNPYLPDNGETVMFKGASHKDGGIDMRFGKNSVEVEGGEPAVKLENGGDAGLTVFGNMKIPSYGVTELHDKNAKGKKFKNYIKELSENEHKQNKIINKSMFAIDDNPLASPYDKLKMSSNEAMLIGANMNLKEIARKKEVASGIQTAILETADEFGLDSDKLSKGKIKKAKMGARIAQAGDSIPSSISRTDMQKWIDAGFMLDPENQNRLFRTTTTPGRTETKYSGEFKPGSEEFQRAFAQARKAKLNEFDFKGKKYNTDLYKGRTNKISFPGTSNTDYIDIYDPESVIGKIANIDPIDLGKIPSPYQTPLTSQKTQGKQRGGFDTLGIANSLLPYLRPSNQLPLDPNQLSGEMYALATNQLDPVQAQLYQPLLENVSDISLQDQLNANQADFNAIQRSVGNNPAALASLAAQKYAANTNVLGEQFRLNQGNRMNVYNKNRGVLNDATLKNLGILDQQYVRQSTAKSNTKATAQAALSSIADKIAKNKLENRTLGIYENLYNYRFGPKGYAYNLNPMADFQFPSNLSALPTYVDELVPEGREAEFNSRGQLKDIGTKAKSKKTFGNGSIVKSLKSY